MKSAIVKVNGKSFRYDYETKMVWWVQKATKEDIEDNREWREKFGHDLFPIEDGYTLIESVGLCEENWTDKESRMEYLSIWSDELDEETSCLADQYLMYG